MPGQRPAAGSGKEWVAQQAHCPVGFGVTGAQRQKIVTMPSPRTSPEVIQQHSTHLLAAQFVVTQQSHKTLHQVPQGAQMLCRQPCLRLLALQQLLLPLLHRLCQRHDVLWQLGQRPCSPGVGVQHGEAVNHCNSMPSEG